MRYFLVNVCNRDGKARIQVAKKQLVWLLKNKVNLEHLEIMALKAGAFKGEYIDSYTRRLLRESA